ncbi:MAG: organoarsenical effux MFS transporter ArsJ [Shewanella sp.]
MTFNIRQYLIVTGNYWAFTLTDGALRMLVVLHFHGLGYSPLQIALLFLFYEVFGVVTNLVGGYVAARLGLNNTMNIGLFLQIAALSMLLLPSAMLSVPWVMAAQALSGIAKDLNKMSAKSSIKLLVPKEAQGQLFKWVALLTGSKNALKGVGFFLGGALLALLGFQTAILAMALVLLLVWIFSLVMLKGDIGKAKHKLKFREIFSKSPAVNTLAAARLCLFGARDVWFVVALPVYLADRLGWAPSNVGAFLALWVIGYGIVQALAPKLTGAASLATASLTKGQGKLPDGRSAFGWAVGLTLVPAAIALGLSFEGSSFEGSIFEGSSTLGFLGELGDADKRYGEVILLGGLLLFGIVFAINSSLHSYLIVSYAKEDGVSLDVGFYYMANAMGRLLGTVLSGAVYQLYGLPACLWISAGLIALAAIISIKLPRQQDFV